MSLFVLPEASHFAEGVLLGLGLFAAPGPKDTLLIREAVSGAPTAAVTAICVGADAVLITLGVGGLGLLISAWPGLVAVLTLGGAAYLVWFGAQRLHACLTGTSMPVDASSSAAHRQVLRSAFFASFANPYAWLDTVILIGSIGAAKPAQLAPSFALGTMVASLIWFVSLALTGRRIGWLFRSARARRLLDAGVAVLMALFAAHLMLSVWKG